MTAAVGTTEARRLFTRRRMQWLQQVARDADWPPNALRLAHELSNYFNRTTGFAWPTQQTLAERIGLTERAIRNLTRRLEQRGYLSVTNRRAPGGGPGRSTIYRMRLKSDEDRANGDREGDTGKSVRGNRKLDALGPEAGFLKNPYEEHYDEQEGSEEKKGTSYANCTSKEQNRTQDSRFGALKIESVFRDRVIAIWPAHAERIPPARAGRLGEHREQALLQALGLSEEEAIHHLGPVFKQIPTDQRAAFNAALAAGELTMTDVASFLIQHGARQKVPHAQTTRFSDGSPSRRPA